MKNTLLALAATFLLSSYAAAQTADVKITLDERFFDALLEAVFLHLDEPSVPLASFTQEPRNEDAFGGANAFINAVSPLYPNLLPPMRAMFRDSGEFCDEAVRLQKEINGVRTAVRFRQGKIYAPIAFRGNYNPPLVGCLEFEGWAETNVDLAFDKNANSLVGNARVLNVNLSGTGGVGGGLIARMVQNSIDRKVNPIKIVPLDKLSFTLPVEKSGNLKMTAKGIRHTVADRALDVFITYEFGKG